MRATDHFTALLKLGLPLVGSLLASFVLGLTDTIMLGWYSVEALAGVTIAGSFFMTLVIIGSGFSMAVTPVVAAAAEQGDDTQIRRTTRMGLWLSVLFGAAIMGPLWWSEGWLIAIGQEPQVAALAQDYLRIAGWGIFPALLVRTLTAYLAAMERTQPILWATLAAAVVNIGLNYALIFGNFGAPEMGVRGAALASGIIQFGLLVFFAWYAQKVMPEHALFQNIWRRDTQAFAHIFQLGWPIALTNLAETGLFTASAVLMGWLGTLPLAAHGIALQVATATFMIHLGLSQATTVRAGRALGRRDADGLALGGKVAIGTSLGVSVMAVAVFIAVPGALVGLFLDPNDPMRDAILPIGITLIYMAALFQFADGLQVIALGLLRGVQDTRAPMWMAAVSYWGLGLPASYLLAFTLGLGAVGVWLGLVVGLLAAAVLLLTRFWGRGAARYVVQVAGT
ncbi:MATE family efflux transporter [Nereida sp. MMG025]|uniref:MATE family efflux transporter n=1 Tax=Nereida sp. MMG025 TaxID=2909981 RepID=UPI001F1FD486|nr:MATE family efflux transporter [Nereida sp. MMG025]MCF6443891.1 MATE family efflux transporter [Nereida sp. MMG025]